MTLKKHDIADLLTLAIKDGDTSVFPQALGDAVQTFGIERLIDATGYTRQKIERATQPEPKPSFEIVHGVIRGIGLAIHFCPKTKNTCNH